jgi:hypothetical protein
MFRGKRRCPSYLGKEGVKHTSILQSCVEPSKLKTELLSEKWLEMKEEAVY